MNNINVKFMDMPHTVRGCVVRDYDGDEYYTIMINSRMSADMQLSAYRHELEHIDCSDFASDHAVDYIEGIRHK